MGAIKSIYNDILLNNITKETAEIIIGKRKEEKWEGIKEQ